MTTLKRTLNPMPADIREELGGAACGQPTTPVRHISATTISAGSVARRRRKRIDPMLSELAGGTHYMGMGWNG